MTTCPSSPISSTRRCTRATRTLRGEQGGEPVFTLTGGDWDEIARELSRGEGTSPEERIVVNMGPQHPSTHGVLRLVVETEGETVTEVRCGIGFLHTGIEKNLEYRNWTQGVTFVTRMDYTTPFYQEVAYCLAVEKLLGVEDQVPRRANVIRVLLMELNRIASHMVCIATGGMEMGALTAMIFGFRERELILDIFEMITGLRMNHAFVRPGGLAQDLPPGAVDKIREFLALMPVRHEGHRGAVQREPDLQGAHRGRRLPRPDRVHGPGRDRAHACAPPGSRTTCASRSRTAATRSTTSMSSPGTAATPTAATGSGWTRCASRSRSSPSAWTSSSPAR